MDQKKKLAFVAAISFITVGFVFNAFLHRTIGNIDGSALWPMAIVLPMLTIGCICVGKLVNPKEK